MNINIKYCKRCDRAFESEKEVCQKCLGEEVFDIDVEGVEWE